VPHPLSSSRAKPSATCSGTYYLLKSNFVLPPQGQKGDIGRGPAGLYEAGANNWDIGLDKNIQFSERYRLQFRWEMFNVFNRTLPRWELVG
jgi:hypothetical protein